MTSDRSVDPNPAPDAAASKLGMDPIERAAIIDEGYDPDDPTVRDALDDVVRILAEHRHLTGDPALSLEHVLDAARAYESGREATYAGTLDIEHVFP